MTPGERRWRAAAAEVGIDVSGASSPLTLQAIWDAAGHDDDAVMRLARRMDEMAVLDPLTEEV